MERGRGCRGRECAGSGRSAGLLLGGCLPPEQDAAQNRCLGYGFHGQNALARCTEIEMASPPSRSPSFGEMNAAQNQCLSLGYRDNALADCIQRHVRGIMGQ